MQQQVSQCTNPLSLMFKWPQDTIVAIARGGQDLTVTNLVTHQYPDVTFSPDPKQVMCGWRRVTSWAWWGDTGV